MRPNFRVIDTGVRGGRANIAFDEALAELHRAGRVGDTIRFLRFEPSALVGRHQAVSQELKLDYCRAHGVGVVRRITGGGAIYLDEGQLGWEVVLSRARLPRQGLADYTRAICEAVAAGLSEQLGIDARFRPRNDIEVGGRKLCGTGGFFDGDTLFYQGTVLIDADPSRVMGCLNVPEAKLRKRELDSPESRIVTLKALLGAPPSIADVKAAVLRGLSHGLGITTHEGTITDEEETLARRRLAEEIGTDDFVYEIDEPRMRGALSASLTGPGGTVQAFIRTEGHGEAERVREALLTGDFFVAPPRLVYDLEAALRGVPIREAGLACERFFAGARPEMLSLRPEDFRAVVEAALAGRVVASSPGSGA